MSSKNKSNQSPKQEPERASERTKRKSAEMKEDAEAAVQAVIEHTPSTPKEELKEKEMQLRNQAIAIESTAAKMGDKITSIAKELQYVANELNTETIFGITAARFQTFADKIGKYPKQLENKAKRERRRLTQTETKEEKKEKKATTLRSKIEALQTKLAQL